MWFKFVVCGVKAGRKSKTAKVFLKYKLNDCPFHVKDESLAEFCLPLGAESQQLKDVMAHEEYTFTLTQSDGARVQGFCRRFLPPAPRAGNKLRYPQVLCLVCEASWSTFFFKVLEVVEQLLRQTDLLLDMERTELPSDSYAGQFLNNLGVVLAEQPQLGSVVRVQLPAVQTPLSMSPPKRICIGGNSCEPLALTGDYVELQVPPDCGNGTCNAGVSLARLLWHVPVPAMLTLIASLLLERRVLVVGQSRDMVSAAVAAASALLYPFKWHHIYLPLLPRSLKDYLTAPMPFLIGMPAQLLPALKGIPMDEFTMIDLDLGRCESPHDDAALLPWREQLEGALHAAFGLLRSPTEHESNPLITNIMQGYFLKLIGNYRSHIYAEGSGPAALSSPRLPLSARSSPRSSGLHPEGSSNSINHSPRTSARGDMSGRHTPNSSMGQDDSMKGHGYWFDHAGMVALHRRNERARSFLQMLRESQMYIEFIQERLQMFAIIPGGPEYSGDPFEQLVNSYLDNRSKRLAARLGLGMRSGISRFTAFVKKHRRTGSQQHLPAIFSSSGAVGSSGGFSSSLSGFADSPEVQRLKHLASMFASVATGAGQMRRNMTEGSNLSALASNSSALASSPPRHRHTVSTIDSLADHISSALDPSAFFEDDDDLEDEAEAAANASNGGGYSGGSTSRSKVGSRSNSSTSLKDLAAREPSWSAGDATGPPLQRRSMPISMVKHDPPQNKLRVPELHEDHAAVQQQQQYNGGFLQQEQQLLQQQQQHGPQQQQRRVSWSNIGPQQPANSSTNSNGSISLRHLLQPQPQQLQRPPLSAAAAAAALAATAGPGTATAAAAASATHRTSQHLHMKTALANIAPGPLPQPPQPKRRAMYSSGNTFLASATNQQLHPGSGIVKVPLQQQQQQKGGFGSPFLCIDSNAVTGHPVTAAATAELQPGKLNVVNAASVAAAAGPGAAWDPFAELLAERTCCSHPVATLQQLQQKQPLAKQELVTSSSGSSSGGSSLIPVALGSRSSNNGSSGSGIDGLIDPLAVLGSSGAASNASSSSGTCHSSSVDPFAPVPATPLPGVTAAVGVLDCSSIGQQLDELLELTSPGHNNKVATADVAASSTGNACSKAAAPGGVTGSMSGDAGVAQLEQLVMGHLLD